MRIIACANEIEWKRLTVAVLIQKVAVLVKQQLFKTPFFYFCDIKIYVYVI